MIFEYESNEPPIGIIKEHSNFVPAPVMLDGERANSSRALWTEAPSSCKDTDYEGFYDMLAHGFGKPLYTLHYKVRK